MARHKFRNRLVVAIVYALLAGGTVYGYIRSEGLEVEVAEAAVVDSARVDSILNLTILVAALPGTTFINVPVAVPGPERIVEVLRIDSFPVLGPERVIYDTVPGKSVIFYETVRVPVPGPIRIETVEVRKPSWTDRILFGAGGIIIGYGIRTLFWDDKSIEIVNIHDHHDHFVIDSVHHHHEHKDDW